MNHPKFIVSNQMEEFICTQRVKYPLDTVVTKQEIHVQQVQHNMMYCVFDQTSTRGHFKFTMHNPSTQCIPIDSSIKFHAVRFGWSFIHFNGSRVKSNKESYYTSGFQIKVRIGKLFSLFLIQNTCCGYSKEPSQ